jgi:hypothetical protein
VFAECRHCSSGFWSLAPVDEFDVRDARWERWRATLAEAQAAGWDGVLEQGQMPGEGMNPTPELAASWFVLDRLPLERAPWYAAEWIVQGYDGQRLVHLAGEHGDDVLTIKEMLPDVFAEVSVQLPTKSEAAKRAFDHVASMCREGHIDERAVAEMVSHIVAAADYEESLYRLPLGGLYGLDDEWDGGWGRPEEALRAEVREACGRQLAATP